MIYYLTNQTQMIPSESLSSSFRTCSKEQLETFLFNYMDEKEDPLGMDIETSGLDFLSDTILLISIGDETDQYVINVPENIEYLRTRQIRSLIRNAYFVLHNGKFDYKFLYTQLDWDFEFDDTMIAEKILTNGQDNLKAKLGELLYRYKIKVDNFYLANKDQMQKSFIGKKTSSFNNKEILYSAYDVKYLGDLFLKQKEILSHNDLDSVYLLEKMVCPVYALIEMNGIYLNKSEWNKTIGHNLIKMKSLTETLDNKLIEVLPEYNVGTQLDIFGGAGRKAQINWNSSDQVLKVFNKLGIECKKKNGNTGTLTDSVADEVISQINHPIAQVLSEHRTISKRLSSFGEKFLEFVHPETGRIHCDFFQLGTETGRVSCTKPNLQQIPAIELYRNCFQAQDGYTLVTCDYEGMELRILADGSQDPTMLEAFRNGEDVHSKMASLMNGGIEVSKKVNSELRSRQKTINFGLA
jgi:DNA polymerase I